MICFAFFFDGKNDRCWMVLPFWDTFNIEIDCSVMRLSCLDELLNNDICYLCHSRDMISKEGPVFWWNLWLMKVDVFVFVFLYKK